MPPKQKAGAKAKATVARGRFTRVKRVVRQRQLKQGNERQMQRRVAVRNMNTLAEETGVPQIGVKSVGKQVEKLIRVLENR